MAGGVFGAYRVEGRVGVGATGTVWKCLHPDTGRQVAIKELDAGLLADPPARERFRDEARTLATFDHPNIVRVYDFVEESDGAWIVEEWIDGAGLDAVAAAGPLRPEDALDVLRGALTGLVAAHDRGILHGDLKPANILVDAAGTSKLVDFGLARPVGSASLGDSTGTPGYAAPELADHGPVTPASDVYAAGAILYELLSGSRLFRGDTPAAVVAAQLRGSPQAVPGIGDRLNDLIGRSTSADPSRRPPDAASFLTELEAAAEDRYGVGWLASSSLAASVAAVGIATMATSSAPGAVGGGAPAVTQTAHLGGPSTAARAGRRVARRWVFGGGTVAAAVVVGVVLFATRAAAAPDVTGRWSVRITITDAATLGVKVGQTVTNTWEVSRSCAKGTCGLALDIQLNKKAGIGSSTTFALVRHGDAFSGSFTGVGPCVTSDGTVLVRRWSRSTDIIRFTVTKRSGDRVLAWSGTATEDAKLIAPDPRCTFAKDQHQVATIVGTRP